MIKTIYKSIFPESYRNTIRNTIQRAVYPLYLGNTFHCNCCNKNFRKLLPKGNVLRLNAKCPYCFSLERERLLDLYFQKELDLYHSTGLSVLHFAPEYALKRKLSCVKQIQYIDVDLNPALASHVADITNIPFDDDSFDIIICNHVLGHIPDEATAICELKRVLKPNGKAFIMTLINHSSEFTIEDHNMRTETGRLSTYGEIDLCRLHGKDFPNRLENGGFYVDVIDYRTTFTKEIQEKYALGDGQREIIFYCTK